MHYPESIRQDVLDAIDSHDVTNDHLRMMLTRLTGCNDTMPRWACDALELPLGTSYGMAGVLWQPPDPH